MGVRGAGYAGHSYCRGDSKADHGRQCPISGQHVGHGSQPQRHLAPQRSANAQGVKAPKCGASEVFTPRCPQRLRRGTGILCVPENPYFQWETTQLLCILHHHPSVDLHVSSGQPY